MPSIQYWFTGAALGAFLALLGGIAGLVGLGYGWYRAAVTEQDNAHTKSKSKADAQNLTKAIDHIAEMIAEANAIEAECFKKDLSVQEINARGRSWMEGACATLTNDLGKSYAVQFRNAPGSLYASSGMRHAVLVSISRPKGRKTP